MEKSIHSDEYGVVVKKLIAIRKAAGLTQRDLAKRLRRTPSVVARMETGDRRVDLAEFFWVCKACGASPNDAANDVMKTMSALQKGHRR
jgi:transcriptional regulator with XRE-family HTH domain